MTTKRNRQPLSFQERLSRFARDTFAAAKKQPGAGHHGLLKAPDSGAAARIDRWLSSPGLQSPK